MNKIRNLRLHQLEVFVEVARHKSVTRAALSLNLSQPAVTRTVRELEQMCGAALITRDGRGIRITHEGEVFLRYAGQSLAAARNGLTALGDLAMTDRPPIRIGALPTVSALLMPAIVNRYLLEGFRSPLRISTGENKTLLDQLRAGELDLVIGRMPAPESMLGLHFEPLYRDIVVFAVHKSHPLAGQMALTGTDLLNWPVLLPSSQSIISPYVKRLFIEQGLQHPSQIIETVSDSFGRAFTRSYSAVWIISRGVIAAELDDGEFVALPINTQSTLGAVGLCTRREPPLEAGADIFSALVRDEVSRQTHLLPLHAAHAT